MEFTQHETELLQMLFNSKAMDPNLPNIPYQDKLMAKFLLENTQFISYEEHHENPNVFTITDEMNKVVDRTNLSHIRIESTDLKTVIKETEEYDLITMYGNIQYNKKNNTIKINGFLRPQEPEDIENQTLKTNMTKLIYIIIDNAPWMKITNKEKEFMKIQEMKSFQKELKNQKITAFLKNNNEDIGKRIKNLVNSIHSLEEQIRDKYESIANYKERIMNLEQKLIYGIPKNKNELPDKTKRLIRYLIRHEDITYFNAGRNGLDIQIEEVPMKVYNKEYTEKKQDEIYQDRPKFRKAFLKIINEEATAYFGAYLIRIHYDDDDKLDYRIHNQDAYHNPHQYADCYGDFLPYINEFKQNNDPLGLLRILMEWLSHINFGDIGLAALPERSYIKDKDGNILYDAEKDREL